MRMSAKAEYAVRAMTHLASLPAGDLITTDEIAKSQGIPAQFLVDILSELRATSGWAVRGEAITICSMPYGG